MDFLPTNLFSTLLLAFTLLFCLANAKALPLAHTIRLLPSLYRVLSAPRTKRSSTSSSSTTEATPSPSTLITTASPTLFIHHLTTSRAIPLDLDINLHKSNSTFFLDADISRATLLTQLLAPTLNGTLFILSGCQASFRREIKPWQRYAISSRVFAWDERALWVGTWFVREGLGRGVEGVEREKGWDLRRVVGEEKGVLAVVVARYVFRRGRGKVAPEEVLRAAGLLGEGAGKGSTEKGVVEKEVVEKIVKAGLEYVKECML